MLREDLVIIARHRKLPHSKATLRSWKSNKLAELLGEITTAESAILAQVKAKRRAFKQKYTREQIVEMARLANLNGSLTAMIDDLLEGEPPRIVLDESQQEALAMAMRSSLLLISAGPGSGKTTTLCHIVKGLCDQSATSRTLVLAYNCVAEETLHARLSGLGATIIPKYALETDMAGVAILTFHKFAYQVHRVRNFSAEDSHEACLRLAIKYLDEGKFAQKWDNLIVDEAQDITVTLASIVDGIRANLPDIRLIAAGDPRQEIYTGATWFSMLWRDTLDEFKTILTYNHRSAPAIVDMLNTYSRANFPGIHGRDQVATRADEGSIRILSASMSGLGEAVADILCSHKPAEIYSIVPVSVNKYRLQDVTAQVRATVHNMRPGSYASYDRTDLHTENIYHISTAMCIKGTERPHVVIYGLDVNYFNMTPTALKKLIFVALSRARDSITIIVREHPSGVLGQILAPIWTIPPSELSIAPRIYSPNYVNRTAVTMHDTDSTGLCMSHIPVTYEFVEAYSPLGLTSRGDSDFVGYYIEALIASKLGIDLDEPIIIEPDKHFKGMHRGTFGCIAYCHPKNADAIKAEIQRVSESRNIPYKHAMILFSIMSNSMWNVSNRFIGCIPDVSSAIETIHRCIGTNIRPWYQQLYEHTILSHRSDYEHVLRGIPDFTIYTSDNAKIPVEIKCVGEIQPQHRRQAAIYATIAGCEKTLLINVGDHSEWVYAADRRQVELFTRAFLCMMMARNTSAMLAQYAIRPTIMSPMIIAYSVNRDGDTITEIGAVALTVPDWTIVDVFHEISAGVRYVELTDENAARKHDTLLRVDHAGNNAILPKFRKWIEVYDGAVLAYWQSSQIGNIGVAVDVRRYGFLPWLEYKGEARNTKTCLISAMAQLFPNYTYAAGRAYEDALAVAMIYATVYNFAGAV